MRRPGYPTQDGTSPSRIILIFHPFIIFIMSKKLRLRSLFMRSGRFSRSSDAENEIKSGNVEVDGTIVKNPEYSIKINAKIRLNGKEMTLAPLTYIILNKQKGTVCQKSANEKTVYDVIASIQEIDQKTRNSLFVVGRLDKDTEGLLIVTNDGQLDYMLTRKENHVIKTYEAGLKETVSENDFETLKAGVEITNEDAGKTFHVRAITMKKLGEKTIEIGIDEGRKRQIKKMLEAIGNEVISLKRTGIGKLRIEDLSFGNNQYIITEKQYLDSVISGKDRKK